MHRTFEIVAPQHMLSAYTTQNVSHKAETHFVFTVRVHYCSNRVRFDDEALGMQCEMLIEMLKAFQEDFSFTRSDRFKDKSFVLCEIEELS